MLSKFSLLALVGAAVAQETPTLAQALAATEELSELAAILETTPELVQTLSNLTNITILAPSNDAFAAVSNATLGALTNDANLLNAVLTYHVLNGTVFASAVTNTSTFVPTLLTDETYAQVEGGQVVNAIQSGDDVVFFTGFNANSTVTTADVNFTGGVIHIIDNLLTIPASVGSTALAAGLTSLVGALNETDLVQTANETADVTIFAPNNAAFQAIAGSLGDLSAEDVTNILTYHVISGTVGYSSDLENGTVLTTANGANLTITINDDRIFVNGARVITADVLVSSGVVHVIDSVLNPNNATIADAEAEEGEVAFEGAEAGDEAPFTSEVPVGTTTIFTPSPTATDSDSPETTGAAAPKQTAALGVGALLGAAAVYFL